MTPSILSIIWRVAGLIPVFSGNAAPQNQLIGPMDTGS